MKAFPSEHPVFWPRRAARTAKDEGFTLVELLVVMVILGMLAAIVTPQVFRYLSKAKSDAARLQVDNLSSALDLFYLEVGRYPSAEEGLTALIASPADANGWNGPYVKRKDSLADPWGIPYRYRFPGEHAPYDLFTYGADKVEGGAGDAKDVANW